MTCQVCRHRLNPVEHPDKSLTYKHGIPMDHDPVPIPEPAAEDSILVCDFCMKPHPTWDFPAAPFHAWTEVLPEVTNDMASINEWAACDDCRLLVEADEYEALAERSYLHQMMHMPDMLNIPKVIVMHSIRDLHEKFRAARTGPPQKIPSMTWVAEQLQEMEEGEANGNRNT